MLLALALILSVTLYRVLTIGSPVLANFSPLMAVAFCGAVYFRSRWLWIVPFAALTLSDLYINHVYATQYGYTFDFADSLVRIACFAAAIGLGLLVARRKNWLNLLSGALGGAVLFYLVTNTASWVGDAYYAKTVAGWWQALTIGHPEHAPTLFFFRNTFLSDLLFTGAFVLAMETRAHLVGRPSLLGTIAGTDSQARA